MAASSTSVGGREAQEDSRVLDRKSERIVWFSEAHASPPSAPVGFKHQAATDRQGTRIPTK